MKIGSRIVIAGVSALVVAGGGTAPAAAVMSTSPVDSSGAIHGCWSNAESKGSHVFVLQDARATCPKATTPISWNVKGPAGPGRGATGATRVRRVRQGRCGPALAGPSTLGPAGLDVTVVQASTSGVGTAVATCPADHPYAVSGGGSVNNAPANFVGTPAPMAASFPVSSDAANPGGWAVIAVYTAAEPGPEGQVSSVTAYADCVK